MSASARTTARRGCGCTSGPPPSLPDPAAACGCCEGIHPVTPESLANRPGLSALRYRVGTHATFLETMLARLSRTEYPALAGLRTRDPRDFSIALLDAWATIADVLTFYQERIANEGYLRTATERRSIAELSRLVGYRLRPGVASSVTLAFRMEKDHDVTIPAGGRAQSAPGPGELPQSFETSEALHARYAWNELPVRTHRPQRITRADALTRAHVFVTGTATNLKRNDPLLFVFGGGSSGRVLRRVKDATPDFDAGRTDVELLPVPKAFPALVASIERALVSTGLPDGPIPASVATPGVERVHLILLQLLRNLLLGVSSAHFQEQAGREANHLRDADSLASPLAEAVAAVIAALEAFAERGDVADAPGTPKPASLRLLVQPLLLPPNAQPASMWALPRSLDAVLERRADTLPQLLSGFHPRLAPTLYPALAAADVTRSELPLQALYVLRVSAPLFGYNARPKVVFNNSHLPEEQALAAASDESPSRLFLDAGYDAVPPAGYVVVSRPGHALSAHRTSDAEVRPRTAYNVSAKTTEIRFAPGEAGWRSDGSDILSLLPSTKVLAQSERLDLADEPVTDEVTGATLELQGLYGALTSGRWIIVSGERLDVPGTHGVTAAELVMIADVTADAILPGDRLHTTLTLAGAGLEYRYVRSTVKINANVVEATHGETRQETLGGGDGSRAFQSFTLKQAPLTYTSAPTAAGAESTLEVRVNDLLWHEKESLLDAGPSGRAYVTRTDDDGSTTIVFGDGQTGARLPTGAENVKAVYRSGIGEPGNVGAGRITLLQTKPLGVDKVDNPLPATGGADPESRDAARANAPLTTMALDRLVSVQDYADFARTYAGIAKASAVRLTDGRRDLVHVTVAGLDDIPIAADSDLLRNLAESLRRLGDPYLTVKVAARERMRVLLSAKVRVAKDHAFDVVAPAVRRALAEALGFDARDLGQPVLLSEVVAVIQGVRGVAWVDVDVLDAVTSKDVLDLLDPAPAPTSPRAASAAPQPAVALKTWVDVPLARFADGPGSASVLPAHLATLSLDVPDTLVLTELKP